MRGVQARGSSGGFAVLFSPCAPLQRVRTGPESRKTAVLRGPLPPPTLPPAPLSSWRQVSSGAGLPSVRGCTVPCGWASTGGGRAHFVFSWKESNAVAVVEGTLISSDARICTEARMPRGSEPHPCV